MQEGTETGGWEKLGQRPDGQEKGHAQEVKGQGKWRGQIIGELGVKNTVMLFPKTLPMKPISASAWRPHTQFLLE